MSGLKDYDFPMIDMNKKVYAGKVTVTIVVIADNDNEAHKAMIEGAQGELEFTPELSAKVEFQEIKSIEDFKHFAKDQEKLDGNCLPWCVGWNNKGFFNGDYSIFEYLDKSLFWERYK